MGCCQASSTLEDNGNDNARHEKLDASLLFQKDAPDSLNGLSQSLENVSTPGRGVPAGSFSVSERLRGKLESKMSNMCLRSCIPKADSPVESVGPASPPVRWYVDLKDWDMLGKAEYNFLLDLVAPEERLGIEKYTREDDRKRALVSRLLARKACADVCRVEHDDVLIRRTESGKPYLAMAHSSRQDQPNFNFNISHDGDFVVIVTDPVFLVGVDIVAPRELTPRRGGIAELSSAFTLAELSMIKSQQTEELREERFALLWSCKEAYAKARGDGLRFKLARSDFSIVSVEEIEGQEGPVQVTLLSVKVDGVLLSRWTFHSCILHGGYRVTVAKGPPCDAVDPSGAFKSTMTLGVDSFSSEEWAEHLESVQPDYVKVPIGFLVPHALREEYRQLGAELPCTSFSPVSPVTRRASHERRALLEPGTGAGLGAAGCCSPPSVHMAPVSGSICSDFSDDEDDHIST